MKITASRLSEGNKIFPAEIDIEDNGLTVKIPGFLGGKTTSFSYVDISSVSVDTPMMGYSSISFSASGTKLKVHGFKKDDVLQIKKAIDEGKNQVRSNNNTSTQFQSEPNNGGTTTIINKGPGLMASAVGSLGTLGGNAISGAFTHMQDSKKEEKDAKLKIEGRVEELAKLSFSKDKNEILDTLNYLMSLANAKPDKNVKSVLIEKIEFGIMKLKGQGAYEEAEFFNSKLEPLKKKGIFGF
jgi:hypothetical protein